MTTNSASGDFKGPVVQAQSIHGNVSFRGGPPDYSHYSSQVERIAPSKLIGREDELGDLAHFCTSPDYEGRYSWWQAEAWSGKSALLATFTLNPPDNVRVIAFFVTAAWSNQSDRRAFVDNILEQLWALLGKEPQRDIPETARETHMIGLLEAAAQHCGYRNERLVLVVDGLDEDRGRDGTEEDHSIGAILPATPPAGMRVIVSGRPSPPLPNDMPDDHPLHDASIVRQLDPSHEARAVRDIMQRDLKRLFRGSKIEQDILGLVTAAGGGLTTSDLAELIGISEWQVEDYLHQAAGRSFRRESEKFGGSLQAHFLAHEQLEAMAHSMLGPQLDSYKERLHRWASSFRERKWPESTPEFLLRGYFNMLVYSGDIDGMIDCATDPHRHNLTRFRVGGDGESINEIMTTQNMIMNTHNPDLESLSRLAVHRVHLQQSNRRIPAGLPAGWARLHQFERAESMTEAIRDPFDRIDARLATAKVCRIEGEVQRSDKLLEQAEQQAQNVDQFWGAGPIESIADTFAGLGDYARAEHVADLISNPAERVKGLFLLVCTAVDDEEYDLARRFVAKSEELLCSDTAGNWASALGAMAVSLRKVGQTERADKLLGDAESALLAEKPPLRRAGPVAQYAALYGDYDRAIRMLGMIDDCASHDRWVRRVISIIAEYDGSRAEKLARSTSESVDASRFCVRLSEVAENDSQSDRAMRLYEEAHNIAYNISDKEAKDNALIAVAIAAANIGKTETAASIAHQYAESGTDSYSLFLVTAAVFRADDFASGVNLLELTENVSRRITSTADERRSLLWIRTMADFQDFDRAERVAKNIRDESARSAAWAVVTEGLLSAGEVNRAERSLSGIQDVSQQRRARLDIIRSLLSDGAVGRATTIAKSAANMADQSDALLVIMEETRNEAILDDVERLVEAMVESKEKLLALLGAVGTAARTHFRSHTVSLLEKLRSVAENCVEHLEDPTDTRIKGIVRTCSTRMRTLTEMSDTVDHHKELIRSRWPKGLLGDIVPPYPPGNSHKNAPAGKEIAFKLANQDWHYSVEDATASCPDCYYAVVHELDKVDELL